MENEDKIEWLTEICTAVYGEHWKPALASQLGINDRSVRQWAGGERTIPDSVIRGLLSLAHDRANLIARKADRKALEMRNQPGFQRVIYAPDVHLPAVPVSDWFDIDGRLFSLSKDGVITDIHGYETDCHGTPVLPDGIAISDLLQAREKHINENGEYD